MTKTKQPAQALEPTITVEITMSTETRQEPVAYIMAFLPDGVPFAVKRGLEVACINALNKVMENIVPGWKSP